MRSESSARVDPATLARDLEQVVRGEVRFDRGARALYATDGSNYRQPPIGVVIPRDKEDVVAAVSVCRQHGAPILPRGCGTSLAGQCCNVAVIIDMSKYMNQVLAVDPKQRLARVQPGCILDDLRNAAEQHQLTFAPDPATHTHNTLGGMIGNNSCGIHAVMGGRTADNIRRLEVLTYRGDRFWVGPTSADALASIIDQGGERGRIYARMKALRDEHADQIRERYPDIPRRVSGYTIDELLPERGFNVARALVGSEGTCVLVLEAECELVHSPPCRLTLVLGYADIYRAGDHAAEVMRFAGITGCEGLDQGLVDDMKSSGLHPGHAALLPEGHGWLLLEIGGDDFDQARARAKAIIDAVEAGDDAPSARLFENANEAEKVWTIRESGLAATAHVPGKEETWPGWEDAAVPPERLGDYLREFRKLMDGHGLSGDLYGHFGQGCIHVRINFDLRTDSGIRRYHAFVEEAADLVVRYGGSLSGEHGDGQARAELLGRMYGESLLDAFRSYKRIWDPDWKMNPGKVVDADGITDNLRLGRDYAPQPVKAVFAYPEDSGDFAEATLRCVGVGECRRMDGGVMCPSFMATREEKHSTRGRARMLFEMLRGDPLTDGWKSEEVKESLELCLACKGCKSDCPVNVDMATYKGEFMSHYYQGRLRPRRQYIFGYLDRWAPLASRLSGISNFFTQTDWLRPLTNRIVGTTRNRKLPKFAPRAFDRAFDGARVGGDALAEQRVILWPDSFNNYFFPGTLHAAARVLTAAGYQPVLPGTRLCCGRPLYDIGMLSRAKRLLGGILDALRTEIRAGTRVVVLEPACCATFRDELVNLLPHDQDALRLCRQTHTLAEFLMQFTDFSPAVHGQALVHPHCNHHAIMTTDADRQLFARIGLDAKMLDAGCCGMSGAFGHEPDKYEVSIACAERKLMPLLREADHPMIIADGYSCREQIMHLSDLKPRHLAEVLADACGRVEH